MPTRVAAMVGKRVIRVAVGQDKRYTFLLLLTAKGDVYSTGHNRCVCAAQAVLCCDVVWCVL